MTILLTIDPSSTSCGYAVLSDHRTLIECGRVTPDAALPTPYRLTRMAIELVEVMQEHRPDIVLIEIPADQAPHGKFGARGQALYGSACGIIYDRILIARGDVPDSIETIQSDKWKRMVYRSKSDKTKGAERARKLRAVFPSYDPKRDPKQDIADAIELGMQWFGKQMVPTGVLT